MNAPMAAWPVPARVPAGRIRLVDVRRRALLLAQLRMLLVGAVFLALAAAALLRIAWIGTIDPAPHQRSMAAALLPPRGEITDRNGVPLARAFPAYALWFNPNAMDDGAATACGDCTSGAPPSSIASGLNHSA